MYHLQHQVKRFKYLHYIVLIFLLLISGQSLQAVSEFTGKPPLTRSAKHYPPELAQESMEGKTVLAAGAERVNLPDFNSYGVVWFPPNFAQQKDHRVLFVIHGSFGNAYAGVYHQLEKARQNNYGIIALQWWQGGNRYMEARMTEAALFKLYMLMAKRYPINSKQLGLETFSRSAAQALETTYWNKMLKHPRYRIVMMQSGGVPPENPTPLMAQMITGELGDQLLNGYQFFMYCGEKDQEWGEKMCQYVHYSAQIIQQQGGKIVRLIDDPNGDHGGMHRNPIHAEEATQAFIKATRL